MKARAIVLQADTAAKRLSPRSFFEGAVPSAPREVVVKPVVGGGGGETGGPKEQTAPAGTGDNSPERTRPRPVCTNAMYVCLSKFNKSEGGLSFRGRFAKWVKNWRKIDALPQLMSKGDPRQTCPGHSGG